MATNSRRGRTRRVASGDGLSTVRVHRCCLLVDSVQRRGTAPDRPPFAPEPRTQCPETGRTRQKRFLEGPVTSGVTL